MKNNKTFLPIIISFCVILLFYFKRFFVLKFYPPICNFVIFLIFFISLFTKETIIQKIARSCGDKLESPAFIYTRRITYVWCVFLFLNFLMSVWTIFLSGKIWLIYNGCISYLLVGLMFGVEYTVRIILRKRNII